MIRPCITEMRHEFFPVEGYLYCAKCGMVLDMETQRAVEQIKQREASIQARHEEIGASEDT